MVLPQLGMEAMDFLPFPCVLRPKFCPAPRLEVRAALTINVTAVSVASRRFSVTGLQADSAILRFPDLLLSC